VTATTDEKALLMPKSSTICRRGCFRESQIRLLILYSATLLLGQAPSQALNQSRLEAYLASSPYPNLDITERIERSPVRRLPHHLNGADTPKELNSRLKILELFTLHILPKNEEWAYARSFICASDLLDDERREAFLQTLQELQETMETEDRAEEIEFHQKREEESKRQREGQEARKCEENGSGKTNPEDAGSAHQRASSEVDYGIEKSLPNGTSAPAAQKSSSRKVPSTKSGASPLGASGRTPLSPPAETSKHRHVRKSPRARSKDIFAQARHLMRALQTLVHNMAGALTANPAVLLRTVLFALAIVMAFSRRAVRERARKIVDSSWNKVRSTVGMGVKVSYL